MTRPGDPMTSGRRRRRGGGAGACRNKAALGIEIEPDALADADASRPPGHEPPHLQLQLLHAARIRDDLEAASSDARARSRRRAVDVAKAQMFARNRFSHWLLK